MERFLSVSFGAHSILLHEEPDSCDAFQLFFERAHTHIFHSFLLETTTPQHKIHCIVYQNKSSKRSIQRFVLKDYKLLFSFQRNCKINYIYCRLQ